MKRMFIAAAVVLGLAVPTSAATIDFTANNATAGNVLDGISWTASGSPRGLSNATHRNNVGCSTYAEWKFACTGSGVGGTSAPFDVGFGIQGGTNGNEIDGSVPQANGDEYVRVVFGDRVVVTGFAGMLTYANSLLLGDREQVILQYLKDNGTWGSVIANPKAVIGNNFDTVGLAFLQGLKLYTTEVRFRAGGFGNSDDGSFNVTAAGLQVAAVPVPAGLPLLLTGLGVLVWGARRKKRMAA